MTTDYPEEINRYNKRVEDLIDDAEIEAELEAEHKIRSKNTRLFLISLVGAGLLIFIYLGVNMPFEDQAPPVPEKPQVARNPAQPKPIPFPLNSPQQAASSPATQKTIGVPPEKSLFQPPATGKNISAAKSNKAAKKPVKARQTNLTSVSKPVVAIKKPSKAKVKTSVKRVAVKAPPLPFAKTDSNPKVQKQSPPLPQKGYWVQAGVFSVKTNADKFVSTLKAKGLNPAIYSRPTQRLMNVVFVGSYKNKNSARESYEELQQAGFDPVLKKNDDNSYTFVLGKFKTKNEANLLRDRLSLKGFLSGVKKSKVQDTNYVVQLGAFRTREEARSIRDKMEQLGYKKTFIKTVG
ncbi:MAG: SPOR domain-containing protein [Nitrospinales bacterium]